MPSPASPHGRFEWLRGALALANECCGSITFEGARVLKTGNPLLRHVTVQLQEPIPQGAKKHLKDLLRALAEPAEIELVRVSFKPHQLEMDALLKTRIVKARFHHDRQDDRRAR